MTVNEKRRRVPKSQKAIVDKDARYAFEEIIDILGLGASYVFLS
jgi:hypothetical protein